MGMDGDTPQNQDLTDALLTGTGSCPTRVAALAGLLAEICAEPLPGQAATGVGLTDRVTVLARVRAVLDAEVARSLVAAEAFDALPHTAATHLQRSAAWSGSDASAVVVAGRFAHRHPDLASLWRSGEVSTAAVAVIARGMRGLTAEVEDQFLAAVIDKLPRLSVKAVKVLLARTLDLLFPDDVESREQTEWDRRSLVATTHGGMTMISADLPGLEGQTVMGVLTALADSLRVAGERSTAAQRRADALITLVNQASSHGDLPATRSGLPVATTITLGVSEADRVASGQAKTPSRDLTADLFGARNPSAVATNARCGATTLGDAAVRFALCAGTHTGVLIDNPPSNGTGGEGGPVSAALTRTRIQPLAVGRAHRFATPAQRVALAVRDGGCILCHRPAAECQAHHLTDWAEGGRTDLDQMVLLCWTHHRQVDLNRWSITRDPDPDQGHWLITPTPRHRWRRRQTQPRAAGSPRGSCGSG